jgi:hypothetical protein
MMIVALVPQVKKQPAMGGNPMAGRNQAILHSVDKLRRAGGKRSESGQVLKNNHGAEDDTRG